MSAIPMRVAKPFFLLITAAALAAAGLAGCGPSGNDDVYVVTFSLGSSPDDLSLLDFHVAYSGGDIGGNGSNADCVLVDSGDDLTLVDDDNGRLDVAIEAPDTNLAEGDKILECDFLSKSQPTTNQFLVTIDSAKDADGITVDTADVDVVVSSVDLSASNTDSAGTGRLE